MLQCSTGYPPTGDVIKTESDLYTSPPPPLRAAPLQTYDVRWVRQLLTAVLLYGKLVRFFRTSSSTRWAKWSMNSIFHLFIQIQWKKLLFSHWKLN